MITAKSSPGILDIHDLSMKKLEFLSIQLAPGHCPRNPPLIILILKSICHIFKVNIKSLEDREFREVVTNIGF